MYPSLATNFGSSPLLSTTVLTAVPNFLIALFLCRKREIPLLESLIMGDIEVEPATGIRLPFEMACEFSDIIMTFSLWEALVFILEFALSGEVVILKYLKFLTILIEYFSK